MARCTSTRSRSSGRATAIRSTSSAWLKSRRFSTAFGARSASASRALTVRQHAWVMRGMKVSPQQQRSHQPNHDKRVHHHQQHQVPRTHVALLRYAHRKDAHLDVKLDQGETRHDADIVCWVPETDIARPPTENQAQQSQLLWVLVGLLGTLMQVESGKTLRPAQKHCFHLHFSVPLTEPRLSCRVDKPHTQSEWSAASDQTSRL